MKLTFEILTGEIEENDISHRAISGEDYTVNDVLQTATIDTDKIALVYYNLSPQNGVQYIEMMVNSQQLMVKYSDELRNKLKELGYNVERYGR